MKLKEEKLSMQKHFTPVGDFTCGPDDPLNNFLQSDSFNYEELHYGNTYVIMDIDTSTVLAFYTLKASGIQTVIDGEYNSLPVIELSRIAVRYEIQNKGFGKTIFYDYILPKVVAVRRIIGVYGIIVFAESDNKSGIRYYNDLGFRRANESIQKMIEESFNEECDLYFASLEDIEDRLQ